MHRAWMVLLLVGVWGCSSPKKEYVRDEIPQGYLDALAAEEGISVDDARKKIMDMRSNRTGMPTAPQQAMASKPPTRTASGQTIYTR